MVIGVGVSTCRLDDLFKAPPGGELIAGGTLARSAARGSKAIVIGKIPVSNTGKGVLTWDAKPLGSSTWFSIQNPSGESKTDSVRVLLNPAGLDTGMYTDSVSITSDVGGTATVLVNWTIVPCQPRGIQAAGEELSDTLTLADCGAPHNAGKQAQIFSFNGNQLDVATVLLSSSAFNGFVALETSLDSAVPPLNTATACLGDPKNPCIYYFTLPSTATYYIEVSGATPADTGLFTVRLISGGGRDPNLVQSLEQRLLPDSTQLVAIGDSVTANVLIHGVVSDSDLVDSLRLQAEWAPIGTNFQGVVMSTGPYTHNGQVASVTLGPLQDNTAYHWQVRAVDQRGNLSSAGTQWDSLPRGSSPDFTVQIGHDPAVPQNLTQLQSDGSTIINPGGTATTTTVKFRGLVQDVDQGDVLHLEVEVEPLTTDTTGQPSPNQTPTFVSSGNTSTATVIAPTIQDQGLYHWIARTVDQGGRHSKWVSFGGNAESQLDFKDSLANTFNLVITSGPPAQTTAGVAMTPPVVVTAQNQFGQTITSFTGSVTMTIASGPGPFAPTATTMVTANAGVAQFNNLIINKAGPGYTFVATSGTTNSLPTGQFTIVPATATQLVFTLPPPPSTTAGVAFNPAIQVSGEDPFGNVNPNFAAPVTMTIAANPGNPPGTLRGLPNPVTPVSGVASFSTLSIDKIGSGYTLRAAATGVTPDTTLPFNITAAPVTHLVFAVQPSTTAAGGVITPAVKVAGHDSLENTVPSFTSNVMVALTIPNGANLGGATTVAASAGTASFSNLTVDKLGSYTLTATSAPLPSAQSASFSIINSNVDSTNSTVTASSPITACASGCTTGGGTASSIQITVLDGSNNPVPGATVQLSATGSNVSFTQPGPTDASGHTSGTMFSDSVGVKVVTAVANGIGISTHPSVTVNPGPAATLTFSTQPGSTGAGAAINSGSGVVLLAKDQFGNTATSYNGITVTMSPIGVAFAPTSVNTAISSAGQVAFTGLRIYQAGSGYQMQASGGSLTSPSSNPFSITVGPAVRDTFTVQPITTAVLDTIDKALGGLKVSVTDSVGNIVTTDNTHQVTMAIFNGTGGATLGGTKTRPVQSGTATFTDLTLDKLGTYQLNAVSNLTGNPSDISASFNIIAGPAKTLVFKTQPSNTVAGSTITPPVRVAALDIVGDTATGFTGNVTMAINPSSGNLGGTLTVAAVSGIATFSNLNASVAGSYTLTASSSPVTSGTSNSFNIVPGGASASQSQVSASSPITACGPPLTCTTGGGTASLIMVTVKDNLGNAIQGATVTLADITGTSDNITQPSGTTDANGQITGTLSSTLAQSKTIQATMTVGANPPVIANQKPPILVNPASPASVQFSRVVNDAASNAVINPVNGVQAEIRDQFNNRVTTATNTVNISILNNAGPGGQLSGTQTATIANGHLVGGVATYNDLTINKTGAGYTFLVAATGLTSDTSNAFNITPGTAAKLAFFQGPTSTTGGATITPAVVVEVQDAAGNRVSSATNSITVAIGTNPNNGNLGGTKTVAASTGQATFNTLSIDSAGGGYTLTASATGLTGATSSAFDITVGTPAKLGFHVQPTNTPGGATIAPSVQVEVQDLGGNRVTTATNTITLAIGTNPGGGTLSGGGATPAVTGRATFSTLSIDKAGNGYTLTASSSGLAGGTSFPFNITPGSAVQLGFVQQPVSTTGGATLAPVTVELEDAGGNRVTSTSATITVAIGTNPNNGNLTGTTSVGTSSGLATFSTLKIDSAGSGYTLTASATGLTGDISNSFNIIVGAANKLGFFVQPQSTTGGATITPAVKVEIQDVGGNRVTSATNSVTVAIGTNPNSGTLGGLKTQSAVAGVATFNNLSIDSASVSNYTLTASASGLTGATSSPFTISVGAATKLGFKVPPSATTGGVAINPAIQVEVRDAGGNRVTSASTSIQLAFGTSPDPSASLSGGGPVSAGSGLATFSGVSIDSAASGYTLVATGGGLTQATSGLFNVTVGPAAKLGFHVQPTTAVAGTSISPSIQVELQDAGGNRVTTNGTPILVAIANNAGGGTLGGNTSRNTASGLATYNNLNINKTGTGYTLQATSGSLAPATSTGFDITPNVADHLAFTVQPSDAVNGNPIVPAVEVTVFDQFGNIANFNGTVTLTVVGGGSGITGNSVSAQAGVATFGNLILDTPGTYNLNADGGGLPTVQSGSFTIS